MALGSPGEYSLWMSALVRQLAAGGDEPRLRDLCERLLGPAHSGAELSPSPAAELGLDGRKLLKEVGAKGSCGWKVSHAESECAPTIIISDCRRR